MNLESLESRQLLAAAQNPAATAGVVVIDSALVASIPQGELSGSLLVAIDSRRDAIDQISTALAGLSDIDVVRVISHGSDGSLWFGDQRIDSAALTARAEDVAGWRRSLTADGDILLYGCSVASTLDGRLFVEQLGSLTQADIAASTDATGQGGDVDLEFRVGDVTNGLLASDAAYEQAGLSLDVETYNSSITHWTNNGNGTVTVTMKYDIKGSFYVAGGGSTQNGYVYMYLNGTQVAYQAVTIDENVTTYSTLTGGWSIGSVTKGSKNLLFTATFAIPTGDNEISVSPRQGFPTVWSDPTPHILRIEAPRYYAVPTSYTAPAGQNFYTPINVLGTPAFVHSATGLPSGLSVSGNSLIGAPASGSAGTYSVRLRVTNGFGVAEYPVTITVTNQAPSFAGTNAAVISGAAEGTPFTIGYAALAAALDDSDPNGDPLSFRIESVLGGTLTKNGTPVTAGTTTIAPGESLVWTPPATVNGTRDAFTVKAFDRALYSATAKTVQVALAAVNDPPTLTQFSGPVAAGNEDSTIAISFADLVAKGDEADIDSTVTAFVVKEVTTGTLRIGTSLGTATPWNATTNKAITASLNAYWTPDANANGPQSAFKAVARDDGNAESVTPVQAVVTVNPINDAPTLTSVAIISGATASDPFEISYVALANAANDADVDGDAVAFRIEAISSGSLDKWTGSAWAAIVPGTTILSDGEKLRWTPVGGSSGLRNAFTVKAWDGQFASATAAQVQVDGDRWRVLPWTDAASSGITSAYRYTHAYSFGAAGSFAINGVTFTGLAGGNPAVAGRLATTGFATVATGDANNLTDATRSLANDAIGSSATAATVTLRGLSPGGRYVLSLYTVGLDSGPRLATLSSLMGQITVEENAYGNNNGLRVDYTYLADASGSVTLNLAVPGSSFNLYGLANREFGAAIRVDAPTSLTYAADPKQFQASLLNYATASNSPFVSSGGSHTVLLKADGTVVVTGSNDSGQANVPAGLNNVVAVSAGGAHTLALRSDGTVVAWGANYSGQSTVPAGLSNVVAISAGNVHSFALKADGTVVAWGSNSSGQCGVPAGLTGIVAISAGAEHSMALKADGTVVAWGYGWYDFSTPPAGLTDVVAISAGQWHSLALKSDGTVVAWGNNGYFQSQVPAGLNGVVAISAGTTNSAALKSDGTVVCWGDRDGYTLNSLPSGMPPGLSGVVSIDVGHVQTVALKSDGTVVSWGRSDPYGQRYLPTPLGALSAISTGLDHTIALRPDGTVIAWGGNDYGQTSVPAGLSNVVAVQAGDQFSVALKSDRTVVSLNNAIGTFAGNVPKPAGLADVVQIAAGREHVLALKADGTVVAWGDNFYGQSSVPAGLSGVVSVAAGGLGSLALKADGTVVYWGSPYAGRGAVPPGLSGVKAIAAGEYFSLALKTDGTVVAWGDSVYNAWQVPAGLRDVVAIEAGYYHALALKADGSIVAWGNSTEVPSAVNGVGVTSLAAGYDNSIALKSDGTIIAWGNNHRGQNSSPAATTFPAVGLAGRMMSVDTPSFTYSYQGRGSTVYAASATPPANAGDYTVTVTGTAAGNAFSTSRNFTIAKATPWLSYYSRVNTIAYGSPLTSDQVGSYGAWGVAGTYVYSPAVGTVLPLGTQTMQVTFLPTDSVNFNPAVATGTITVTAAAVTPAAIAFTPPASLTYTGTAKAYTASAPGVAGFTYSYSGRAGTSYGPSAVAPTYTGNYTVTATANDPNYTGTKSLDFTIAKATPTITTNPTASALTFGQTLGSSTLSGGVASVPGSFAFVYAGTEPSGGTSSYDVIFTPTDTNNYTTATGTASVTVAPLVIAAGAFTFSTPASLVYSASPKYFGSSALGPWGSLYTTRTYSGVAGTTYGPSATAPTNAGSYAVTATVWGSNFSGSATRTFTITQAVPTITWATPANIAYGTALSATQLNATANVAGSFAYSQASGTVLAAGARTLEAVFTPTDTVNFASMTASVPLTVTATTKPLSLLAPPSLTYDGSAKPYLISQNAYLAANSYHSLVLKADGTVVAWGRNDQGQATVPAGLSGVVQVSAGYSHSVAVKSNGTIVGWGNNSYQQYSGYPVNWDRYVAGQDPALILPRDLITTAVAAAAGGHFTAVLLADGTVTVLGNSDYTSTLNIPAGLTGVTAIAAGYHHAVALRSDGTVVAWGSSPSQDYGQATVPAGLSGVVAISAGFGHTVALKSDGTVVAWGNNAQGQCSVPADLSGVVAIAAGDSMSYAVKADGTVVGWGYRYSLVVPADVTGVAALALGYQHAIAIKTDGTVAAWGSDYDGQATVPAGLTGAGNFSFASSYAGRAGTTYAASSSAPTNAGSYTVTVSSTNPNYSASKTVDFTIAKATPTITTLPQASIIVEGQPLSAALLDGGVASVSGTFAFSIPSFVPSAGATTQEITFTPTDTVNYDTVIRTVTVLSQGTRAASPAILALPTAAPITFGQRLQASTLSGGSASVPGTFVYSSRLAVPNPGTARQSVTFIPDDIASYAAVTILVPLTVYDGIISPLNIPLVPPASLTYDGSPKAFAVSRSGLISGFYRHVLIANTDGTVTASGDNFLGGCDVPAGLSGVVAVSAGDSISLALKSDGSVVEWGGEASWGPLFGRPPAGLNGVVAIARSGHGLALKSDGTVVAWGDNNSGQRDVPAGLNSVVAIAASGTASFALKSDGTVVAWGGNTYGEQNIPAGLSGVVAIDAGPYGGVVALKADGMVVTWGGGPTAPADLSGVVAVAAGYNHMTALKADGTVVAWGSNTVFSPGAANTNVVPSELSGVVAISAGSNQTYALKADGSVVWWGQGSDTGAYKVNGQVVYFPGMGAVSVPRATPIAGASAGFAFTTTYAGREGTVYAASSMAPTSPGDYSVTVIGTNSAFTTPKTYAFSIAQATPAITVPPTATGITYGQTLAASVLSGGTASVPGTFAFAASATAPSAGTTSQDVVFTPDDTTNYLPVTISVSVAVARATPTLVTLPTATTIAFGQTLASATLGSGLASVAGTFAFTAPGTAPAAGTAARSVTFTPTDSANYLPFTANVDVLVTRATPSVTVSPAATSIRYGQSLAGAILSGGTASVPGTFAFADTSLAPASGTANQAVVFTPTDIANYAPVTLGVAVHVRSFDPGDVSDIAGEAGGVANAAAGFDAIGNVLDGQANYDGTAIAVTAVTGPGGAGAVGSAIAGRYGSLTLHADGSYGYVVDNANAAVQTLAIGETLIDTFSYTVESATDSATAALRVTLYGSNDAPTFSSLGGGPLKHVNEDTETSITFAELFAAGNTADVDGTVVAFVVASLAGGTLRIGSDAASALPWDANSNSLVDATTNAYWTPAADLSGTLPAFAVVARDDGGTVSPTPVTVHIAVTPVNDAPTLSPVEIDFIDTIAADTFATVSSTLTASDVDADSLTFGITGVTAVGDIFTQAGTYGTLMVNRLTGTYAFTPNAAAINAATADVSETFPIVVSDGTATTAALLTISITATDDRPTLAALASGATVGTEDTLAEISFADLLAAGDEGDVDGTVTAFMVTEVKTGRLAIGTSAADATVWNATTNRLISSTLKAFWTPDADSNGLLDAFAVVASDDGGNESTTPIVYRVSVASVNDAPLLMSFATVVGTTAEDTPVTLTFAALAAVGTQADIDGTVTAFVVTSVTSGTLTIGATAATATPWDAVANAVITTGLQAYWRPVANASGTLDAFSVVARDDGGLDSPVPMLVSVLVAAVNDPPVNAVPGAQTVNEDTDLVFSAGNGNAISVADVDIGSLPAEVTLSVTSGVLSLGSTTGLTFTTGDGTADATLVFSGTRSDVNAALAGLVYRPAANFHGSDLLTITTSDLGGSGSGGVLTDTDTVAITVVSVVDAPTNIAISTATVAENLPGGTAVGTLSTTDDDAGDTFTYTLVAGTGDTDNAAFTIAGNTLKTVASFDYEAKSSYAVRVRTTDAGGLTYERFFAIAVTNVNEAAVISLPEPFGNEVVEDVAIDGAGFLTATGQFSVVDPDAGESAFGTSVTAPDGQTNLGTLSVDTNGNYVYKVLNSSNAVQALRAGAIQTDVFVIRSLDGTTRNVSFRITGAADTLAGAVADGYLAGATLFADSNGNGLRDWTDAGSMNGVWDAGEGEAWTTTDANGDFIFDFGDPAATLVTIGGTDISTGMAFSGSLSAPAGSTIVNPLTTLVAATIKQSSLAPAAAAAAVRAALGLPASLDLMTYDPLAQTAGDATALEVQKAAATVANMIVVSTNNGIDTSAALGNLAAFITASPTATVDLQSSAVLTSVLTVTVGSSTTPPPAALVTGLVLANTAVNEAESITEVAASQEVVQQGTPFTAPTITSIAAATFATGIAGSFQFVADGYPAPTFSAAGTLPAGVTLSAGGLLSGTPAAGTAGQYVLTVTATNGINPAATQTFTLTVTQTDDVAVTVEANKVVLTLAPTGVSISSLHTAYNAKANVLTITAMQPGTMVAAGSATPGVTVNSAAKTIVVNLGVMTGFAGISVVGNGGVDAITIGGAGVNLAAVTRGSANQSFTIDTRGGATDLVMIGKPITAKGSGSVSITTRATDPARGTRFAAGVTTGTGSQAYAGPMNLVANTVLTAGAGISFSGTLDGAKSLSLAAGGAITFADAVGTMAALKGLAVLRAASVAVNGAFQLNGTGTAAGANGLTIAAGVNNVVFSELGGGSRTIQNFSGSGIRFAGGSMNSTITGIVSRGNGTGISFAAGGYTGTRVRNNTFDANARYGVVLDGATNLLLGGTAVNAGNRIINSTAWKAYSTGIQASGNLAGTRVQGNTISGNAGNGVVLVAARGITIGGATPNAGNTIQNNNGFGLLASGISSGALVQGNTITGNRMGTANVRAAKGLRLS